MKKIYILLLIFISSSNQFTRGQYVLLTAPVYQGVYQRDINNNANIPIAGQITSPTGSSYSVSCTNKLNESGVVISGTSSTSSITSSAPKGLFNGTISRPIGWYSLTITITITGSSGVSSYTTTSKCGVGDVFILAGQSNGQGQPGNAIPSTVIPEWVVGNNEEWNCRKGFENIPNMTKISGNNLIGPAGNNSWCYGVLGKRISDRNGGMPVAFFNTCAGGSSVKNWRDGAYANYTDITTAAKRFNDLSQWCINFVAGQTDPLYYIGQPYLTLRNTLNWYIPLFGVRAVLWHQGESDAFNSFNPNSELTRNSATYTTLLNDVIAKSRTDFGSTNLSWMIAQVSYSKDNMSGETSIPNSNANAVRNGQSGSTNGGSVLLGPLTDMYTYRVSLFSPFITVGTGIYRNPAVTDQTHFDELANGGVAANGGVTVLANLWSSKVDPIVPVIPSPLTSFNRIPSTPVPTLSVVKSGSNFIFSVPSGSSAYCWTIGNTYAPPLSGCLSTTNTHTISSGSTRCFVRNGNNWQSTAQALALVSCTSCREGVEENDETYGGINMKLYPNPTDKDFRVEFDVPEDDTHVKLEFFDMMGNSVKVIADGSHAKGHFNYPITEALPTGASICQLKVGEIFISKKLIKVN